MNVGAALLLVAIVTLGLVLWFTVALWVGTVLGRAIRAGQGQQGLHEDEEAEQDAHEAQGTRRLRFPRGAP